MFHPSNLLSENLGSIKKKVNTSPYMQGPPGLGAFLIAAQSWLTLSLSPGGWTRLSSELQRLVCSLTGLLSDVQV